MGIPHLNPEVRYNTIDKNLMKTAYLLILNLQMFERASIIGTIIILVIHTTIINITTKNIGRE
jgi:hypothetical protein